MSRLHPILRTVALVVSLHAGFQGGLQIDLAHADAPESVHFELDGTLRVRFEALDETYRTREDRSDRLLVERLLVHGKLHAGPFTLGLELADSRAMLHDEATPLGTDDVNALEPQQIYLDLVRTDALRRGDRLELRAGRITIDAGSRRLVARNRFRNTINTFSGLHATWYGVRGAQVQAFAVLPHQRQPSDREGLEDGEFEFDSADFDTRFWGLFVTRDVGRAEIRAEGYVLGLHEDDTPAISTRDRNLVTTGLRLWKPSRAGAWDFELETAVQSGTSRANPSATRDLDHFASFVHVQVGRSLRTSWPLRLVAQFDRASGDDGPDDGDQGRFDTLFGARRFEFGPTGIYGAFARANVLSPGGRVQWRAPHEHSILDRGFFAYRAVWLASETDAWTTAGLRDPSGGAGGFLGHQVEMRVRMRVPAWPVRVELGGAALFEGDFPRRVRGEGDARRPLYGYAQTTLDF